MLRAADGGDDADAHRGAADDRRLRALGVDAARYAASRRAREAALPALAAIAAYGAWVLLRPAATADNYARIVLEHGGAFVGADSPLAAIGASLLRQANAVAEGWVGVPAAVLGGRPAAARPLLAGAVGCLALAGMALRLAAGKADGWMMAAYLATLLAWPFYDQMGRFLFPVLPVLILYAFWRCGAALRALGRPPVLAHGLLAASCVLSLTLPALAFIGQRAQAAGRYARDRRLVPDAGPCRGARAAPRCTSTCSPTWRRSAR